MAKYVIHKKGFFYTDEGFEIDHTAAGSMTGEFDNLEDAKKEKSIQDIASMQKVVKMNVVDFYQHNDNYTRIQQNLKAFYNSEFGKNIENDLDYFTFPDSIDEELAKKFLEVLELSFHHIMEYDDDVILDPEDFNLMEQEMDEF